MDNDDYLIRLDDVNYRVQGAQLLNHISLSIAKNERINLIGPNGAGKSTLVKLILGLITPTSGVITRKTIMMSYVPQKFAIPSILPLRTQDLLNQANQKRLNQHQKAFIFDKLLLTPLLKRQIHHLSGGEMQRVLLARSLLDKPELLILDEPMQGLDPDSETWLYNFIDDMPDFLRCGMLVVSHDLHWVMKGSRRVICLNKHICCQGKPSQIATTTEFSSLFGHYMPYIHHHDHCQHHY